MRVDIAAVGRMRAGAEADLVARYLARAEKAGRAVGLSGFDVSEHDESRQATAALRKAQEADRLLSAGTAGGVSVALDETGRHLSSTKFASVIGTWRDDGRPTAVFLIGGPDGHDGSVLERADLVLALGVMTLPHLLARAVLAEQLYRAVTILAGHPYHRG